MSLKVKSKIKSLKAKSSKVKSKSQSSNGNSKNKNDDLHGNAPDHSSAALLLIDVINDLDFPQNEELVRNSVALADRIAELKQRCQRAGIPAIYINDNRGRWRSDVCEILKHCLNKNSPGRAMVERLVPAAEDYIILKPKHSSFYATPLDTLLEYIGVKTVILAGITTNACVLITAADVYVRDLQLFVPSDCVAALTSNDQRKSLELMARNFSADTRPSSELDFNTLAGRPRKAA